MRPLARDLKDNETNNDTRDYSFPLKLSYEDNMKEASERSLSFFVELDIRIDLKQTPARCTSELPVTSHGTFIHSLFHSFVQGTENAVRVAEWLVRCVSNHRSLGRVRR